MLLTAASKAHRVFQIPEMLEVILYELPTKDLLLSKAVCKMWRDTIDSSVKLQKALFMIEDGDERVMLSTGMLGDAYRRRVQPADMSN